MLDDLAEEIRTNRLEALFCPRCRKARATHGRSCPECGDWLEIQGYCSVCEARWNLPVGTPCPKHEIELAAESAEPSHFAEAEPESGWVFVESYNLAVQAQAARLRLEAEGIPAQLHGLRMATTYLWAIATGGIRLMVPARFEQEARVLLSQSWDMPFDKNDDDLGEASADDPDVESRSRAFGVAKALFWGGVLIWAVMAIASIV